MHSFPSLFSSGTTGVPKGAVLTQANCVASIVAVAAVGDAGTFASVNNTDTYISYLPLAHVFERVAQGLHVYRGASIGYYQVKVQVLFRCMNVILILQIDVFKRVTLQSCWMILLN